MKKILILLSVFLLTGCSVEYNLNFNDEKLEENISIILSGDSYNDVAIEQLKKEKVFAIYDGIGKEEYDITFKDNNDIFTSNYKHTYSLEDYNRGTIINQCYDAIGFAKNEDEYMLTTSNEFRCLYYNYMDVDSVKISITTNHKVVSNNADMVEKNTYIWEINESNAKNKPIRIVFSEETKKSLWDIIVEMNVLYFFLIAVVIAGGIIFTLAYMKDKKNNTI